MKQFILENWTSLCAMAVNLFAMIIALIFKKKPVSNLKTEIISKMLVYIPLWICEAEKTGKSGVEKKAFVIKKCKDYVTKEIELNYKELKNVENIAHFAIEDILSTPQKKSS